jgi:sec-independent protein translocase protein TatB
VPLNLSFTHIMVVLVVALIVLGPDKLPEAARTLARWVGEFRRMSAGLQADVRDTFGDFAEPLGDLVNSVRGGVGDLIGPNDGALPTEPPPSAAGGPPLASLPALGAPRGPVSPGPALDGPVAARPLDHLAPLGGAAPVVGTFAAFPGAGAPPAPPVNGHVAETASPSNGQSSTAAGGAEPTGASGPSDDAGADATGAVEATGAQTTG